MCMTLILPLMSEMEKAQPAYQTSMYSNSHTNLVRLLVHLSMWYGTPFNLVRYTIQFGAVHLLMWYSKPTNVVQYTY